MPSAGLALPALQMVLLNSGDNDTVLVQKFLETWADPVEEGSVLRRGGARKATPASWDFRATGRMWLLTRFKARRIEAPPQPARRSSRCHRGTPGRRGCSGRQSAARSPPP